jgi:hypothetical protein
MRHGLVSGRPAGPVILAGGGLITRVEDRAGGLFRAGLHLVRVADSMVARALAGPPLGSRLARGERVPARPRPWRAPAVSAG